MGAAVLDEPINVTTQRITTCDTPEEGGLSCTAQLGYCVVSVRLSDVQKSERQCLGWSTKRGSETSQEAGTEAE